MPTPNDTTNVPLITPALADFQARLTDADTVWVGAATTLTLNSKARLWSAYQIIKRNGEIVSDWLVAEEFAQARDILAKNGFIRDESWTTTPPPVAIFVRSTP